MNIDVKELFAAISQAVVNPLVVPVVMLVGAAKFEDASVEALVFFGLLGIAALIFTAWVVSSKNGDRDADS